MKIYVNQIGANENKLSMNFPGVYNLLVPTDKYNFAYQPFEKLDKVGILITIFIFVILAFIVLYKKIEFNKESIITVGLVSVIIATFFLPHMHDRYLYMGDILAIMYLFCQKNKFYIPITIELISLYAYSRCLFGNNSIPIQIVSLVLFVVLIILLKELYTKYFKKDANILVISDGQKQK